MSFSLPPLFLCVHAQLCLTLCDPMDDSPPGSSVLGILQARVLEQVAVFFSRGSSQPGIEPKSVTPPTLAGRFFTTEPPGKPVCCINSSYLFIPCYWFCFLIITILMDVR